MEKQQKTKARRLPKSDGFSYSRTNSNKTQVKSYAATGEPPFIFFTLKKPVFYVVNGLSMGIVR